jgi:hypothetical protein
VLLQNNVEQMINKNYQIHRESCLQILESVFSKATKIYVILKLPDGLQMAIIGKCYTMMPTHSMISSLYFIFIYLFIGTLLHRIVHHH